MKQVEQFRFSPQGASSDKIIIQVTTTEEKWANRVHIWQPPTDLYETNEAYIVQVEIAGMEAAEFLVSLESRTLVVHGERFVPNKGHAYYQMEIPSGEFISMINLPGPVDHSAIRAEYEDGFLKIELPKAKPGQVDVTG